MLRRSRNPESTLNVDHQSAADIVPIRNFVSTRRALRAMLAVSLLVPIAWLLAYGYFDYSRRFDEAASADDRLARVAEEQAVKVFDLNQEIQARVLEQLGNQNDKALIAKRSALHDFLASLDAGFPQVAAVSLFGPGGELLVTSASSATPAISIEDRDDFQGAKALEGTTYFSQALLSRAKHIGIFTSSTARMDQQNHLLGVVSIALRRDYFTDFYREIVEHDDALVLGLYRQDAALLARFPAPPNDKPISRDTEFTRALRDQLYGRLRMVSTIDGVDKLISFRKVGNYPLYVSAGTSVSALTRDWFSHLLIVTVITAIPCIAVWLMIWFSLRQLAAEQAVWERWQNEVAMRMSAEASTRQLQRMGALGNLIANVAHDFNNLLMAVTSNMALIHQRHIRESGREIAAIEASISSGEALNRRLLSVARKQPLHPHRIDLHSWLDRLRPLLHTALGDRTELSMHVTQDVWPIFMDATELEFAIMNIVLNAVDAMSATAGTGATPAGGRFIIRAQNVHANFSDDALSHSDSVSLMLSDNGTGMSDAVLSRAFEPLFTTKSQGSGTGLGLAQVLAACEQANGTARIDSVTGSGTTVRLYFPRYFGPELAQPAPTRSELSQTTGSPIKSILLVEDNESVAAGIAAVLETLGCSVRHLLTADDALDVIKSGDHFDVVLSDIQMPGRLNGIDLAAYVLQKSPRQRIALMTGYSDDLARAQALCLRVFAKPFDIAALADFIDA